MLSPWKKSYYKPRQCIKKWRHPFANKSLYSQRYGFVFSSSYVQIWELDLQEGWVLKNWCFQIVMLEKTAENPLDHKEIKLVNPKWNSPWIFTGRTDAEAEAPIVWPPDVKSRLIGKDPDAGRRRRGDRRRDGWMASPTQLTWIWANSWRRWRTGKPGVLKSMGSQRIRHNLLTEQHRTLGIFPKAVPSQQQNWGGFKLRVHAYLWRGFRREEFTIELWPRSTESKP